MCIGILKCGQLFDIICGEFGDYDIMFEWLLVGCGFDFISYYVEVMEFFVLVYDVQGWLLIGLCYGVYEDYVFILLFEVFICDVYVVYVFMVGICFGYQIIVQVFGGKVEKYVGGWLVGVQDYDFGGQYIMLNVWYQDQVMCCFEGVQIVVMNGFCENVVLVYDDCVLIVQVYLEFGDDFIQGLIDICVKGVVFDDLLVCVVLWMGGLCQFDVIVDWIENFFKVLCVL